MQVEIKYFQEDDRFEALKLGEYFSYTPYQVDPRFCQLTAVKTPNLYANQFDNPRIKVIVARVDGELVGTLSFMVEEDINSAMQAIDLLSPVSASILFVVVKPEYQNKKIAQRLIHVCLDQLKKVGVQLVRIGTDGGNFPAMALYQKFDFKINLIWNSYRLYKDDLKASEYVVSFNPVSDYPLPALLERSIPWFYIPDLSNKALAGFFYEKVQEQIKSNRLAGVRDLQEQIQLFLRRDITREQHYGIKGSLWMIDDIITDQYDSYAADVIRSLLCKMPDFTMAETWVNAHDYKKQQFLADLGMKLSYTGISFYKFIEEQ